MRRIYRLVLVLLLAVVLIKTAWVLLALPGTAHAQTRDVTSRLSYLVKRQLEPEFFETHTLNPGGIFAGEWRLVSLSMTAAALVNQSFAEPTQRAQNAASVDALI